jgi:RNA polymerase sigma-70 factor (ECF subfamily)
MSNSENAARALLEPVAGGDESALGALLGAYRARLRAEVAAELSADPRLAARFDASDVVQERFLDARGQIGQYLAREERVEFWVWLRGLARERRLKFVRDHLDTQCRSAKRQQALPDESARHPVAPGDSPSRAAQSAEEAERLGAELRRLAPEDREVIRLRVTEGRTNAEVAARLGMTAAAAAKRLEGALRRLRAAANPTVGGSGP